MKPVNLLGGGAGIREFCDCIVSDIHSHIGQRAFARGWSTNVPPCFQVGKVVVVKDIQNDVFGRVSLFHLLHTQVSLINAVAADAKVFNRLA